MDHYELPPSLSIPHGDIDAEHQSLIDALNTALQMIRTADGTSANNFYFYLENLREGLKRHFQHEEHEMAALGYPDLEQHKRSHLKCVQRLDDICDAVARRQRKIDKDLLDEMFDIIMDDAIRADSGFKSFLEGKDMRVHV
jgi:hemerythrin-like metal-binding protein